MLTPEICLHFSNKANLYTKDYKNYGTSYSGYPENSSRICCYPNFKCYFRLVKKQTLLGVLRSDFLPARLPRLLAFRLTLQKVASKLQYRMDLLANIMAVGRRY